MSLFRFVGFGLVSIVAACATSETVSENASSADANGTFTEAGSSLSSNNAMLPHQRAVSILQHFRTVSLRSSNQCEQPRTSRRNLAKRCASTNRLLCFHSMVKLSDLCSQNAQVAQLGTECCKLNCTIDGVSEYEANPIETVFSTALFEGYLSSFASAEHVSLDVHEADVSEDSATCKIFFDLREKIALAY